MSINETPAYNILPEIILGEFSFTRLSPAFITAISASVPDTGVNRFFDVAPVSIAINKGVFINPGGGIVFPQVELFYNDIKLSLKCGCGNQGPKLCDHQAQVLYNIMERNDLRIFFDASLRLEKIKTVSINYGLENDSRLGEFFELSWSNKNISITPKQKNLQPVNKESLQQLETSLLSSAQAPPQSPAKNQHQKNILVLSEHKYYKHLQVGLYEAAVTNNGKIKNPVYQLDSLSYAWKANDAAEVKFYSGIATLAQNHDKAIEDKFLQALKAIAKNPLQLAAFCHTATRAENISAGNLQAIHLSTLSPLLELQVYFRDPFYEISGQLTIGDKSYQLNNLPLKYGYFIFIENSLQLIADINLLKVIAYFKQYNNIIVIHQSKFEEFRTTILAKLEDIIKVNYAWLVAATPEQLEENGFTGTPEPLIYLSDAGVHVTISPVMRYGEVEVSVLSKRQLFARDLKGAAFIIDRDDEAELALTALLLKQHPEFLEQLHQESFYLTKKDFLEEGWFLDAIEQWNAQGIKVSGFNEIDKRLNPNKAVVSVNVVSGLDWFDTNLDVRYGKQKASLRHLHKAVMNGSKYVTLDDGTLGTLPAVWVEKMDAYFKAGEIAGDKIRTPRINFSGITELYDAEMLSGEVKQQVSFYNEKLSSFESIEAVDLPEGLNAVLRHYQHDGLNWLNFLDDFGFGGCLADDMGLGKTIQVIAFILLLKQKHGKKTNLVVVPTSLVFNWQDELEKFAPSLKVLTFHGNNRVKNSVEFDEFDVVLTTYGTLLSASHLLTKYHFHYIFLDESQAIKNPDSQRYKAARLLQAKNRIVLTGTPIENNTFDLYGQLSFCCPGLLGNRQYFKDIYSQPIDQFGDSRRAKALQRKVNPFILRRTKKQVATELPEKTEMTIFCEMAAEQRQVYDAYEREFRNYLLHQPEEDLPRNGMHILQGLTKLRQICNSPALLNDSRFYGDASAKTEVLIKQIESKHKEHKILVFSQFVGMLDIIRKELAAKYISYEYLTGKTKDRESVVKNFQSNNDIRVLLVSLKAGGTGLNLTEADYVYIVDPWWNPAVENQAIDRCYRIGQEKHIVAVRLICPKTIEEKIMQLQTAKKELAGTLVKTDTGVLKQLKKEDLLKLLGDDDL